MTPVQRAIYAVLTSLPAGEGLTAGELVARVREKEEYVSEPGIRKAIARLPSSIDIKNRRGLGYFLSQAHRNS